MKKFLLFIIFVLATFSAYAAPNNPYEEWDEDAQEYRYKKAPFLQAAMKGIVKVKMVFEPGQEDTVDAHENLVKEAINDWFAVAAKMIEDANRQEEFADVYPMFTRGITVSFLKSSADLLIFVYKDGEGVKKACQDELAIGCHNPGIRRIAIARAGVFNDEEKFLVTLKHEVGQALGFGDQYGGEIYTDMDISRRYGSPEQSECSIMNKADKICPDDVDGLINAIDLERLARGTPSPRGPWRGFMGRYIYLNGEVYGGRKISPSAEKFTLEDVEEDGKGIYWRVEKDNKEGPASTLLYKFKIEHSPIDIQKVIQQPIVLDGGVVVPMAITTGTGPNKERVVCYDLFRRTVCFGFMNRDMVWTQIFNRDFVDKQEGRGLVRALFFKYNGLLVTITWKYDPNGIPTVLHVAEQREGEKEEDSFYVLISTNKEDPSFVSTEIENEDKAVFLAPKKEKKKMKQ